jgi:toxin ParE1/3/4
MKRWHITDRAKRDLADIRRFTQEQWGLQKADAYLNNIYGKIQLVSKQPGIGIDRSKSLQLDYEIRSLLCVSHVIYYTVSKMDISVVAILHKCMIPKKHLMLNLQD